MGGGLKERPFPKARVDCLSRRLDNEVVIYDPQSHRGHCLNSTSAAVWKLCDGNTSPLQIAEALSRQVSARVDQRVVQLALRQLADVNLLVEPEDLAKATSRRMTIRRFGVAAAIAVPLITSIIAPTPAQAATCLHSGAPCSTGGQCCSGLCLVGRCLLGAARKPRAK
jgi:hypothetical protein